MTTATTVMETVNAPPELSPALLAAVRAALRGDSVSFPPLAEGDVTALRAHGMTPLLYAIAKPAALRGDAIRAAAIEPLREQDAREILRLLAAAGVETLILKGTALAYQLYDAPELRPRADTDLLVSRDDMESVRRVFTGAGFVEALTSGDEHALHQTSFTRTGPAGIEHSYDVHWAVTNSPLFASVLPFDEVRQRAVPLPVLAAEALALHRVDALLLACVHRVAHHHDTERLIWLVDIALLRERMSLQEHEDFWRRAARGRVIAVCARSIELADDLYSRAHEHGPERWLSAETLRQDEPTRVFLDRDLTYGGLLLVNLRSLPWRHRLQRLWQLAFPPRPFMEQTFGTTRSLALPLLYVYRAARGVGRLFRRADR